MKELVFLTSGSDTKYERSGVDREAYQCSCAVLA